MMAKHAKERDEDDEELVLKEKVSYAGLAGLDDVNPPKVVVGPSGWVYHSTSLGT